MPSIPATAAIPATPNQQMSPAEQREQYRDQAIANFREYMEKTPAELMREKILEQMGLTEEQLEAMPPEERQAIEEKIMAIMKQWMEQKTEKSVTQPKQQEPVQTLVKLGVETQAGLLEAQKIEEDKPLA